MTHRSDRSRPKERVLVSTFVAVAPETAFEIFTRDIDTWWKRSPRYRRMPGQQGTLGFEGAPPEHLIERTQDTTHVLGRVLTWDVGKRLVFEWRGGDFSASDQTQVDIRFAAASGGTRVTLEHRGIEALPLDHVARHGLSGEAFEGMLGYFWGDLLIAYRLRCG